MSAPSAHQKTNRSRRVLTRGGRQTLVNAHAAGILTDSACVVETAEVLCTISSRRAFSSSVQESRDMVLGCLSSSVSGYVPCPSWNTLWQFLHSMSNFCSAGLLSPSRREGRSAGTRRLLNHSMPPFLRLLRVLRRRQWRGVEYIAQSPQSPQRATFI